MGIMSLAMGLSTVENPTKDPMAFPCEPPKIPKLKDFRYKFFPGFIELLSHKYIIKANFGEVLLEGSPKVYLVNINTITKVCEFGDKRKGYSSLVYTKGEDAPLIVLQSYKEVLGAIRKAAEGKVGS